MTHSADASTELERNKRRNQKRTWSRRSNKYTTCEIKEKKESNKDYHIDLKYAYDKVPWELCGFLRKATNFV